MNSEYIIETNGTVRECLQRCLDTGCIPLTLKEVIQAKKDGKIPSNKWYDTSTIQLQGGKIKDATEQDLRDILSGESGALLVDNLDDLSLAYGYNNLDSDGSFVRRSSPTKEITDNLLEELSELEHEQWREWAKNIWRTESRLSVKRKERWARLIHIKYGELTEKQKEDDRKWARKVLAILEKRIKVQ